MAHIELNAIDLAWDLRRVSADEIRRPVLPTSGGVINDGEFVLLPREPFDVFLQSSYAD